MNQQSSRRLAPRPSPSADPAPDRPRRPGPARSPQALFDRADVDHLVDRLDLPFADDAGKSAAAPRAQVTSGKPAPAAPRLAAVKMAAPKPAPAPVARPAEEDASARITVRAPRDPEMDGRPTVPAPPPPPLPVIPPLDVPVDATKHLAQTRPDLRRLGRTLLASGPVRAPVAEAAPPRDELPAPLELPPLPAVVITELEPADPAAASAPEPPAPVIALVADPARGPEPKRAPLTSAAMTEQLRLDTATPARARILWSLAACVVAMGALATWGMVRSSVGPGMAPSTLIAPQEAADRTAPPSPEQAMEAARAPEPFAPPATVTAQPASVPAPGDVKPAQPGDSKAPAQRSARAGAGRRPPPTRIAMDTDPSAQPAAAPGHARAPALSGRIFGDEEEQ